MFRNTKIKRAKREARREAHREAFIKAAMYPENHVPSGWAYPSRIYDEDRDPASFEPLCDQFLPAFDERSKTFHTP